MRNESLNMEKINLSLHKGEGERHFSHRSPGSHDHLLLYEEDRKRRIKGVLFGNAWRNLPISKRGSQDMPYFPESVLERAKQFEIALVASGDFFDVFCKFIEKADVAETMLDSMMTQTGRVDFTQIARMGGASRREDWAQNPIRREGREDSL